jgi:hypothetical protein
MSAIAISEDAGTNKNNGIHNSRCSRDILIDRIDDSSPPSVTVLELNNNNKKEAVGYFYKFLNMLNLVSLAVIASTPITPTASKRALKDPNSGTIRVPAISICSTPLSKSIDSVLT